MTACAIPADAAAGNLAEAFRATLAAGGLPAAGATPAIWYLNLVYYTGPVRDAGALIDWVTARRHAMVTDILVTDIQIMRWRHTSTGMVPVILASANRRRPGHRLAHGYCVPRCGQLSRTLIMISHPGCGSEPRTSAFDSREQSHRDVPVAYAPGVLSQGTVPDRTESCL
jgi:hypothetical protein